MPYSGNGSGLGLSIYNCRKYLQEPFIFISSDTLVREKIAKPSCNWMAYDNIKNKVDYRTINIIDKKVFGINEKKDNNIKLAKPYIGLASIYDYKVFWSQYNKLNKEAINTGEVYGLKKLIEKKIIAKKFTWLDTGNLINLKKIKKIYAEKNSPNILEKKDEAIWFIDNTVIKFSNDIDFIKNRVLRSKKLRNFVPVISRVKKNFYAYKKVRGKILSKIIDKKIFLKLLAHSEKFWKKQELSNYEIKIFKKDCLNFYNSKTIDRVKVFNKKYKNMEKVLTINGKKTPKLSYLLKKVDWSSLSDGVPVRFHGDFHFENIIYNKANATFHFLDWRQDFSGRLDCGDIYYDFAKLLHGMIVSHEKIVKNKYFVKNKYSNYEYNTERKKESIESEKLFLEWLINKEFNVKKVYILTALIFLNIAPLHHSPYDKFLYVLGIDMLNKEL